MTSSPLRRLAAALALAVQIGAGLAVHALLPDIAATDIAGDALYAGAVYAGLVLIVPRGRLAVIAVAAASWCVAVELLQLTGLPRMLGTVIPLSTLVLGTVFDPRDLVVYVAAVAAAALLDALVTARHRWQTVSGLPVAPPPRTMEP